MISVDGKLIQSTKRVAHSEWLSVLFFSLALLLGLLHAIAAASSHSMNADGISYLDMGDAFMRGDFSDAAVSMWSPAYALILGAIFHFINPPMALEFPLVHITNFAIYVFALISFLFLWRQVMKYQQTRVKTSDYPGFIGLPDWAMWGLGYAIFIASSLILIEIWSVTPDMLMAAFVYLAGALFLKILLGDIRWRNFALLGFVLGLGYLAKAIMLPVSILFLAATFFAVADRRSSIQRVLLALFVFFLAIVPYVGFTAAFQGDYTRVSAGTFTYAKHVNGIPFSHWQGETPGNGTPEHPSRKIFDAPPVYEFGTPISGTYPISYDPSYWNAGLKIYFSWQQQLEALLISLLYYYEIFAGLFGALTIGIILFYTMGRRTKFQLNTLLSEWALAFIAIAVLVFYAIVLASGRYIGAFVVLLFANLIANVRLLDTVANKKFAAIISILATLFILGNVFAFSLAGYGDLSGAPTPQTTDLGQVRPPSWPGEVAESLHQLGIKEGDRVGVIGYGFDSFWARLARVQIVAELLEQDADSFWYGDPVLRAEVTQAFAGAGVKAIVAESVPANVFLNGWNQVGDSNYYIFLTSE
jgi:hypothetical protein